MTFSEVEEGLRTLLQETDDEPDTWVRRCPHCGRAMRIARPYCSSECSLAAFPQVQDCHLPEAEESHEIIE